VLYTLNLLADQAPAEVAAEHRRWAQCHAAFPGAGGRLLAASGPSDRRLRVGYVSPDFVLHAVSFFILPILAAHDRNRWEVFCYSNARVADAVTGRIRGLAEHWRDIARLSDDAAAELIRRDGLDVLIDLAGHTAHNRLLVFARRPAPVQATWLGYPNTTGLPQIDYRLTDAVSDPPGTTEAWHSEKLWRLPGPFLCYEPPAVAPAVNALPADPADGVTFACFNNLAKINPELVGLWARLLRDVPGSRLLLKSPGLADPPTVAAVRARFAAAGVAGDRIGCDGTRLSVADHLGLYRGVDVALDAHPYNGTTTTCEALLMGVPVVTLAGQVHAARVGASLLTHLGRSEWIAATADAYVEIARGLAGDRSRLGAIRAELRAQLLRSPLCDAVGFTRRLESAYSGMLAQPSAERAGGFGRVAGPTACGKSVA
jgi:predicted O-linked N-acetylglucosamine transferase (SPINDLY family)